MAIGGAVRRVASGPQKAAYSDGATSKTPGMEICKARPSGDSHGLAYFHL